MTHLLGAINCHWSEIIGRMFKFRSNISYLKFILYFFVVFKYFENYLLKIRDNVNLRVIWIHIFPLIFRFCRYLEYWILHLILFHLFFLGYILFIYNWSWCSQISYQWRCNSRTTWGCEDTYCSIRSELAFIYHY